MRGKVLYNEILAGYIEKLPDKSFRFSYNDEYFLDKTLPSISVTFPKTKQVFASATMFSFFDGLLSEGINKMIQCRLYKIDEDDDFSRLLLTANHDSIGAVTVKPDENEMSGML